jgi:hypothetical protein
VTLDDMKGLKDCPYCDCPVAGHTDNGLMVWCESDMCSRIGVEPFSPCIHDLDDEEVMAVFQREIHYR